ncbi:OmpA family protein [Corticibacter populi]|uniref:OmpA family protein n=1 Tax=Corticibacter populi TaxID=1550736 RepID=A0A3M6QPD1_9BURK|nr:OmpA family protein [Corticibacter populi]RMX04865.1 OmpA family protein [Corticibacter populi]RZS33712.1 OmpA family protein [Corticibacter populi]
MRKTHYWIPIIATALCAAAHAGEPLLPALPGYTLSSTKQENAAGYPEAMMERFWCTENTYCDGKAPGFDEEGHLVVEGTLAQFVFSENPTDTRLSEQAINRNLDAALRQAGAELLTAVPDSMPMHVYLLKKPGSSTWIVTEVNYSSSYKLTQIEQKEAGQLISANQLRQSIETQGFATLHINFDNNKADIRSDAAPALQEVAQLLKQDPQLRLAVQGHTDDVGTAAANKALSQRRAESVVATLVQAGIDAARLRAEGHGAEQPVQDNRSEAGRAANRRVELVKLD